MGRRLGPDGEQTRSDARGEEIEKPAAGRDLLKMRRRRPRAGNNRLLSRRAQATKLVPKVEQQHPEERLDECHHQQRVWSQEDRLWAGEQVPRGSTTCSASWPTRFAPAAGRDGRSLAGATSGGTGAEGRPERRSGGRLGHNSRLFCLIFSLIYLTLSSLLLHSVWPTGAGLASALERQQQQVGRQRHQQPSNPFLIFDQEPPAASALLAAGSQTSETQQQHRRRSRPPSGAAAATGRQPQQGGRQATGGQSSSSADSLLVCPEGWQRHSSQCYKFFQQRHSWQRARDICEHYGAQLALVYDYQQNNFTTQLAQAALGAGSGGGGGGSTSAFGGQEAGGRQPIYASDERSYWIGFRAIDRLETNTLESAANTFVSKYLGFWDLDEPQVSRGECVRATIRHEAGAAGNSYRLLGQTTSEYLLIWAHHDAPAAGPV